jgi:hypothetical protein
MSDLARQLAAMTGRLVENLNVEARRLPVIREAEPERRSGITFWQRLYIGSGGYEFEYDEHGYTDWYRCIGGRLADGRWPEWNTKTKEVRYS